MQTKLQTVDASELDLAVAMRAVEPKKVEAGRKRNVSIVDKRATDHPDQAESKDFATVRKLATDEMFIRLCIALKIDARGILASEDMTDAELTKRGFEVEARTRNMKAAKKFLEIANYIASPIAPLETVVKSFTACSVLAARHTAEIPRDVQKQFLNSVPLHQMSSELASEVQEYRAKQMTGGGADTQSSQCSLVLANLRAARIIRSGKRKFIALEPTSPVLRAIAQRLGMVSNVDAIPVRFAPPEPTAEVTE